jgi:1-acyl-sn-glycerol-3-phosphate acyltransferase
MSELESALIATYLSNQELHFFAKDSYWKKGRGWAWFMNATGQIPISQSGGDAATEQMAKGVIYAKDGKVTCWYPEGTRGSDGNVHKGHGGAVRMAVQAGGIPIVPVGLIGMAKFNRPGKLIRPGLAKMVIGKPIYPLRHAPRDKANLTEKALQYAIARVVTDVMMKEIARLARTSYDPTYSPIGAAGRRKK